MPVQPDFKIKQQNIAGGYYLYTTEPMRSYVVEVELSSPIDGNLLQGAVDDTLERMPYFADALVERDGDFYYAENPLPFEVAEGGLRAVGGPETNWHCMDVTYRGSTVDFAMYHAFCDGLGLNFFIESVLYHYFCRKDGVAYPTDGIRAKGTPPLPDEEIDPSARAWNVELTPELMGLLGLMRKPSYRLPEAEEEVLDHMVAVPIRVDVDEFVAFARSCGSSPAPTLATLMADAVRAVHPECAEDISALIPATSRPMLDAPNTFKDAATAARVFYEPYEAESLSFAERAAKARQSMRAQLVPEIVRFRVDASRARLEKAMAETEGFAGRKSALNGIGGMTEPSFTIDYVGALRANGYADQLVSTKYLAATMNEGVGQLELFVTATGGVFSFVVARSFTSDVYDRALCAELERHGIAYELGKPETFVTPRNGLIGALGYA